jgi:hypothetical protein
VLETSSSSASAKALLTLESVSSDLPGSLLRPSLDELLQVIDLCHPTAALREARDVGEFRLTDDAGERLPHHPRDEVPGRPLLFRGELQEIRFVAPRHEGVAQGEREAILEGDCLRVLRDEVTARESIAEDA